MEKKYYLERVTVITNRSSKAQIEYVQLNCTNILEKIKALILISNIKDCKFKQNSIKYSI